MKLEFDPVYDDFDRFAALCSQDYNYGDKDRWFLTYRRSLDGAMNRVSGAFQSYTALKASRPQGIAHRNLDTDLSNLFFNMDSSLECLVYAFNALGYGTIRADFYDISSRNELGKIGPANLTGKPYTDPPKLPLEGYSTMLPSVVDLWQSKLDILQFIMQTHDVSKHRESIFSGANFSPLERESYLATINSVEYKALSKEQRDMVWINWPVQPKAITLHPDPKRPYAEMSPLVYEDAVQLDDVVANWIDLINETGRLGYLDVRENIELTESEFRTPPAT